jgi:transcriptional regulator of acetoin/glycerol metabolism
VERSSNLRDIEVLQDIADENACAMRLVCLNCAAIPDSLLESELFGYVKGAFTGATGRMTGKLEMAQEGTIFFDEVGDMSLFSQSKMLRVIDTRDIYPLGAHRPVSVDARIIAATNQDLDLRVREGRFRADLLYRLNVAGTRRCSQLTACTKFEAEALPPQPKRPSDWRLRRPETAFALRIGVFTVSK